ncbi:hypothetical protein U9M48_020578 [Paspalum notatum var. saurae]|uniref:Ubiquitin-conjugating enzyme E2 23 n=1 Tax=Paspalum notatum var. saurae TaxID=547442 RepID=A0AAQ3TIH2_PASNO
MESLPNGSVNSAEPNQEYVGGSEREEPDTFVYRNDVVSLKSNEDAHGLVLKVVGEYDSEGSITDDDGTDNKVRVLWTDGTEKMEDIDNVVSVDRSSHLGDLVASASDPTGQMGLVVNVNLVVDLQLSSGDVIKGVSSKDLRRIREFNVDDYVVSGPWIGQVYEVLDNVNVLFDDASVCKVNRAGPMRLKPTVGPIHADTTCPFYPGQRVKAVSPSVFKTSRWLNGSWKARHLEGTVTKVENVAVIVNWIASAHFSTDQQSVPPEEQNPKDLTLLSHFSYANWQLTDWCLPYQYSSCTDDAMIESSELKELNSDEHTGKICKCAESSALLSNSSESQVDVQTEHDQKIDTDANHRQKDVDSPADGFSMSNGDSSCIAKESESGTSISTIPNEGSQYNTSYRKRFTKMFITKDKRTNKRHDSFEQALLIANTHTKVDVLWQDRAKECGVTSTSLVPIHSPNDHEFFPEQYVVDKVTNDVDGSSGPKRMGLVKSVNAKDRTASVSWFKPSLHPEEPKEIECNEIVSAYELDGHPDYDYSYGAVVARLPSVSPMIKPVMNSTCIHYEALRPIYIHQYMKGNIHITP